MKSLVGFTKYAVRQYLLGTAIVIDLFLGGAGHTFSKTLISKLKSNHSLISIAPEEELWIVAAPGLACIPGALLSPFLMELFGRKWSYVTVATWNILAWLMTSYSTHSWQLLFSRALQGFNEGLSYVLSVCFIAEIAPLRRRAQLLNLINLGTALGVLFSDAIGHYNCWRASAFILACLAAVDVALLFFAKNTHVWYAQRGRMEDAKAAFFWYRPSDADNVQALNEELLLYSGSGSFAQVRLEWARREFLAPLCIMGWFTLALASSGGFAIAPYAVDVISEALPLDGYHVTLVIDAVCVAVVAMALILLEYAPMRWMINTASVACALSLLTLTATLYWQETWRGLPVLSFIMVVFYCIFNHVGLVNMWPVCLGQLFTGVAKASGTALSAMTAFGLRFAMDRLLPMMLAHLGLLSFLIFTVCTIIGGLGLFLLMPETRGVSNEKMRAGFVRKSSAISTLQKYEGPGAF